MIPVHRGEEDRAGTDEDGGRELLRHDVDLEGRAAGMGDHAGEAAEEAPDAARAPIRLGRSGGLLAVAQHAAQRESDRDQPDGENDGRVRDLRRQQIAEEDAQQRSGRQGCKIAAVEVPPEGPDRDHVLRDQ